MPSRISIIIPVLNDAEALSSLAVDLQALKARGHQIIIVDGGSRDASVETARSITDDVICGEAGRALQMNVGAAVARHDLFWFIHADSRLPACADRLIIDTACRHLATLWGRFDIQFRNSSLIFRLIAMFMNLRSRITGIATGDQAIFVSRTLFESCGGFPVIPLMEDVAISKLLKKKRKPVCCGQKITASSRRWESNGVFRTIVLMWWLRLAYFFGLRPEILHRWYYAKH
ncbi:MAG: TIGR04283 family arsenosugar biosynthesis glycosyltransferase [Gammaproteobacteria bacterium]|nr:TIGR04283 family arsenosugar biosynthesis glycosyltransferase [Gammaproteobacteria bacterium]